MERARRFRNRTTVVVPLVYLAVALVWIAVSDWLVARAVPADLIRFWSTAKGTLFVLVTAAALYLTLREAARRQTALEARARAVEERERIEGRRLQRETLRANRALRMLSACNEALVRARSEGELLREVCRSVVETGGFAFAWVGYVEHDAAKTIRPAAQWGPHEDYGASLKLTWDEQDPRGRGPAGIAVRERRPVLFTDHAGEPRFAPWREKAREHEFVGSIALPLLRDADCFGVLAFYASDPEAFDAPVPDLLAQLADDLAYGLSALRTHEALRTSREELRALATRIEEIREEEKARFARDLHDDMGQLLTAAKLDLRAVERRIAELPPDAVAGALLDRTLEASGLIDQAVASIQRIAAELRPLALDQLGLPAALRQEGRRFEERTGIACAVSAPDRLGALPPAAVTALYRIAQESLTNVARHAEATRVDVSLEVDPAAAVLRVQDDGRGLPPDGEARRGLGLLGMRERAQRLGGEVRVDRAPRGTVVTARLPLAAAQEAT